MSIATGTTPGEPLPAPEPPTWRSREAAALADALDGALGVDASASVKAGEIECDEAVLQRIRDINHRLLYPLSAGDLYGFAKIEARAHAASKRAADAEPRAKDAEQCALAAEHRAALAEGRRADNVAQLRPVPTC
jgi:hypothetical protein